MLTRTQLIDSQNFMRREDDYQNTEKLHHAVSLAVSERNTDSEQWFAQSEALVNLLHVRMLKFMQSFIYEF